MSKNQLTWNFFWMIVAIVAIVILIAVLQKSCGDGADPGTGKNPDSLVYWKNRAGDLTTSLLASRYDFEVMEERYLDSIAVVYATKTKYIKETIEIASKFDTKLDPVGPPEIEVDTAGIKDCPPCPTAMRQIFRSKFYEADVRLGRNPFLRLKGTDSLIAVWKQVKQDGKTFVQLDITNANPDVKITGVKAFRYEQPKTKQKKWSVGIQSGFGMTLDGSVVEVRPYFGLGLNYSLIRF